MQYGDVEHFTADGVLMKDGSVEKADLIVATTGYESQQTVIERLLGPEIANKVGQVWGVAPDGELANMYRPTPQKGLD